jgi:hypothetical protein
VADEILTQELTDSVWGEGDRCVKSDDGRGGELEARTAIVTGAIGIGKLLDVMNDQEHVGARRHEGEEA